MRWHNPPKPVHIIGATKIIPKFLWLPMTLDGETRWLERADVIYRYVEICNYADLSVYYDWKPEHWGDY